MIVPGQTVFITSTCVNRCFRYVPKREVVEVIECCLAAKLEKYAFDLHAFCFMSDHYHLVMTAPTDQIPDFMRDLNSLISKGLNALRGIRGSNVEDHYNMVVVTDPDKILEHCAYTLANPCAAHLVTRADKWRGPTSARMQFGVPRTVQRPTRGLWSKSPSRRRSTDAAKRASRGGRWRTPEASQLVITRPPGFEHLTDESLLDALMRKVVVLEDEAEQARVRSGRRVVGMRAVRARHWNDRARSNQEYFESEPLVSGKDPAARARQLDAIKAFRKAYAAARDRYASGERDVEFPFGTWMMRRRFNVCCACAP